LEGGVEGVENYKIFGERGWGGIDAGPFLKRVNLIQELLHLLMNIH
jgi:hypothetical protein